MLYLMLLVPVASPLYDCWQSGVDAIWCALQIGDWIGLTSAIKSLVTVGLVIGGTFLFINMLRGRNGGGSGGD